ncbi:MAG: T9SS type A sorting domain-containing protein, partial [Flavobacteriales bacterium]
CTVSSETVTVTEPDAISINGLSADPIDETPGGSSSFDVTGGTGDYSFEWTDEDGNVVSTSQNLSGLDQASDAGTYTLTVTDENGCSESQTISITGLGEINFGVATVLVPNPTMGQFQIRFSGLTGERLEYRIVDTQGRTILFSDLGNAGGQRTETIDISGVAAGIYYVQINIAGNTHSLKLIKQ